MSELRNARKCVHAMVALAEVDGDPFLVEDAKRKLDRDVGPLEGEIAMRSGRSSSRNGKGSTTTTTTMMGGGGRDMLFGNRGSGGVGGVGSSSSSYAPPSIGNDDVESGSSTTTFATLDNNTRMEESERLLRETQALCAESEQIGNMTLETMGRQREQIERSGGLIERSIENTRLARQIMKEM